MSVHGQPRGLEYKIAAVGRCGGATTSEAKTLGYQNVSQHPTFISTCFTFGKMQPGGETAAQGRTTLMPASETAAQAALL